MEFPNLVLATFHPRRIRAFVLLNDIQHTFSTREQEQ